jgi:glyoxylase-like metal-dependent hydrolase (beta-lactamase superfamily II)
MAPRITTLCAAALLAAGGLFPALAAAQAQEPKRSITQVRGDLYRFQNNFHNSVFLVTPDGVIATDPIDAAAAAWLENEIRTRFGKEIRYLIYSHDHRDHAAGGEVWADTATVIAHEDTKAAIVGEKRPTAVPQVTFRERATVELGGKQVELIFPGRSHSNNTIVVHFPAERAVFTVDFISVKTVAFRDLPDSYWPDWIDAIKTVEAMDFDILVPGHGPNGTKADANEHRRYLEALYTQVLAAVREGLSLEQTQARVNLDEFKHFGQFADWMPLNVAGMYQRVALLRRGN